MANFCRECGSPLDPGAKFCANCGAATGNGAGNQQSLPAYRQAAEQWKQNRMVEQSSRQQPAYQRQNPVYQQPQGQQYRYAPPQTGKKKRGTRFLSLFLAILMLGELYVAGFHYPGFLTNRSGTLTVDNGEITPLTEAELLQALSEPTAGASSIAFDSATYAVEPERASVSENTPTASLQSGVSLSFDNLCLTDTPQEVQVKCLGTQGDGEYQAIGYDLLFNGSEAEFLGLVEVTLPYDPAWGENVFVQYLNEETGAWEIIFAAPDGYGNITFCTDHFCTFAVFKNMVDTGVGTQAGDILIVHENGLESTVEVNWGALAKSLRDGKLSADAKLSDLTSKGDAYWMERTMSDLGNTNSGIDFFSQAAGIPGMSKILGPLGQALTVVKFLYQCRQNGLAKALNDNSGDLAMMGVGMAGEAAGGAIGAAATFITFAYYVYSMTDSLVTNISLRGQGSVEEAAYRTFSAKYLFYNRRTATFQYKYAPPTSSGLQAAEPMDDERYLQPLTCGPDEASNANWVTVLEDAQRMEKAGRMSANRYLDLMIDRYVNAFWSVRQNVLKQYLSDAGFSSYKAPDTKTRQTYIQNFKNDLYAWLKPYLENEMEKKYQAAMSATYSYFLELETVLNEPYKLELIDPEVDDFSQSSFARYHIGLATSASDTPTIYLSDDSGIIRFTGLEYMRAGCPKVLRVLGGPGDRLNYARNYFVKQIDIQPGLNTVVLDLPEEVANIEDFIGEWDIREVNENGRSYEGQLILTESTWVYYANGNYAAYDPRPCTYKLDDNVLTIYEGGDQKAVITMIDDNHVNYHTETVIAAERIVTDMTLTRYGAETGY